jgi:hypothetical protein
MWQDPLEAFFNDDGVFQVSTPKEKWLPNNCDFSNISFVESKEFYEIHVHPCIKRRLVWKYSVARELENDNRISYRVVYYCW